MRAGWLVGLGVLAKATRKIARKGPTRSREGAESRETESQAYMPSRRPSLQRCAPARPSTSRNVVYFPLESFDIGAFLRELDALRRSMSQSASAFDETRTKYGVAAAPQRQCHDSAIDPSMNNDVLARAVKQLGKTRY